MANLVTTKRLTVDEFYDIYPAESRLVELIDGKMIETPPPKDPHGKATTRLLLLIGSFVLPSRLGALRSAPGGFCLDDHHYLEPDLFFVTEDNQRCKIGEDSYWQGAPDLIIEVLSLSTARYDRVVKMKLYAKHGIQEYWLVDTEARYVEVYRLEGDAFMLAGDYGENEAFTSPLLPGLTINMSEIFHKYS